MDQREGMIGAFMATTVTHNPKSMLKMHLFQEVNIRLMKAEIMLREHLQGVACVSVPEYTEICWDDWM